MANRRRPFLMPLRLSRETRDAVAAIAERENVPMSEVLRRIVEPAVRRRVERERETEQATVPA